MQEAEVRHNNRGPPLLEGGPAQQEVLRTRRTLCLSTDLRRIDAAIGPKSRRQPLSATIANVYRPLHPASIGRLRPSRSPAVRKSLTTPATSTGLAVGFGPRVTLGSSVAPIHPNVRFPRSSPTSREEFDGFWLCSHSLYRLSTLLKSSQWESAVAGRNRGISPHGGIKEASFRNAGCTGAAALHYTVCGPGLAVRRT